MICYYDDNDYDVVWSSLKSLMTGTWYPMVSNFILLSIHTKYP